MTREATSSNLGVPTLADATTKAGKLCLEALEAALSNFCIAHLTHATSLIVSKMCLETCEAPWPYFGIAKLADATSRVVSQMCLEACEAPRAYFGIAHFTHAAAGVVSQQCCLETCEAPGAYLGIAPFTDATLGVVSQQCCLDTCEAPGAYLGIAPLTNPTSGVVRDMGFETSEATSPNFCITSLAGSTAVPSVICKTSKARGTNFLISAGTNYAPRGCPPIVDHLAAQAREATRTAKFAVSLLANSTTTANLIESTRKAVGTNLFKALCALTTTWALEMVINNARQAT